MFIQTETTPNPNTIKFLPGCEVAGPQSVDVTSVDEAKTKSPLAERLFKVDGVTSVFLGNDFVSISKDDSFDWVLLKPQILTMILEHFSNGLPVLSDEQEQDFSSAGHEILPEDDEITIQIKELLETRVRPAVAQDGGDIVFQSFDDGIVYLQMRGACAGCPSSSMTLKMGIENMLKHYIPEVIEVRPVEG